MKKVMNGVVEVVNSYEDGELSVRKCGLSEWEWLWGVMGGIKSVNALGEVEDVVFESEVNWNELEKVLKEKYKEYKEGEIEYGYGGGCDEDGNDVEFDWDKVENEMLEGVKELFEDGMEVSRVLVGGYSVECDNEFVVIVMKM